MSRIAAFLVLACVLQAPHRVGAEDAPPIRLVTSADAAVYLDGAATPLAPVRPGSWEVTADVGRSHAFLFRLPPCDDTTLTVTWDPRASGWLIASCQPRQSLAQKQWFDAGRPTPLEPEQPVYFCKTCRLNVRPPDARIYVRLENDLALLTSDAVRPVRHALVLGGETRWVTPLADTAERPVTVPLLYRNALYAERPRYRAALVAVDEAALRVPGIPLAPAAAVVLEPLYGPFSDWRFAVAVGAVAAAMGVAVLAWLPRRKRRRAAEQRSVALAERIGLEAAERAPGERLPPLLGSRLRTEGGEAFVILAPLGEGGMGAVFEAASAEPGRPLEERWAVKMLFPDAWQDGEFRERFRREVSICCSLQHPGVVHVLDWGMFQPPSGDALPFMVMELVPGRDLRKVLDEKVPTLEQALAWCTEILSALRVAHARHIVHRDLKPENVMITDRGRVKLMDFGISRQTDRKTLTATGTTLGTPAYMSPENVDARRVTPASDIYSLGVILYEMLAGRLPYEAGDPLQYLMKMLTEDPPPLADLRPDLPAGLCAVVMRMLERDPADRYASAQEVAEALAAYRSRGRV